MDIGFKHLHTFVVSLLLFLMAIRLFYLYSGRKNAYISFNNNKVVFVVSRIVDVLMLTTGLYLMFKAPNGQDVLHISKFALVVIATGLAIVGSKKMSGPMMLTSLLILGYVFGIARQRDFLLRPESAQVKSALEALPKDAKAEVRGKVIYTIACQRCHGETGNARYYKSSDLTTSKMDVKAVVTNGIGLMPKFEYLSENDKEALDAYVRTLRK